MSAPEPPAPGLGLYYLGMFVKGAAWSPDVTDSVRETQAKHLAYNAAMYQKGVYKLVGPFHEPFHPEWRGMILIKADSMHDATDILNADPAVQTGRLAFELSAVWLSKASIGDF